MHLAVTYPTDVKDAPAPARQSKPDDDEDDDDENDTIFTVIPINTNALGA